MLIGVPSSGLHTNGYSLARRIAFELAGFGASSIVPELGVSVGEALLTPHRSYLQVVEPLLDDGRDHGDGAHHRRRDHRQPAANPPGRRSRGRRSTAWPVPPLFAWLQRTGNVPVDDMFRTFNMGIGLIIACRPSDEASVIESLRRSGESSARRIGEIASGGSGVRYVDG